MQAGTGGGEPAVERQEPVRAARPRVQEHAHMLKLLLWKGYYPSDYMDNAAPFEKHKPASKDTFSHGHDAGIKDVDSPHAERVWSSAGGARFAEYHPLYVKSMHSFIHLLLLSRYITLLLLSACISLLLLYFS